ncbi:hypothetical protein GCM10029964_103250 [Kibdelosporangium lantanae]
MSDPYRPGQYPAGPDQTTRIPPVRSHGGPPRGPRPPAPAGQPNPDRTKQWVLRGLGLLVVAVVSGMLWWLVQQGGGQSSSDGDTPATSGAKPAGKYTFAKAAELPGAVRDSDCEEHSYNKVKTFFKDHRCVSLTRQLFTADVNGHKVYSSVSVVQMANAADAQALKALTEQDGTGNVTDVLKDKGVKAGGLKLLANGGFDAKVSGSSVVIVESDFDGSKPTDGDLLDGVSTDALRLGDEVSRAG